MTDYEKLLSECDWWIVVDYDGAAAFRSEAEALEQVHPDDRVPGAAIHVVPAAALREVMAERDTAARSSNMLLVQIGAIASLLGCSGSEVFRRVSETMMERDTALAAVDTHAAARACTRTDILDLLEVCGIQPAGIMSDAEDLLAVRRYVEALKKTAKEPKR